MEGMLIVAPVILLLLGFWLFSGSAIMLVLLPIVVTTGAGAFVIARVLREGRGPPDRGGGRAGPRDRTAGIPKTIRGVATCSIHAAYRRGRASSVEDCFNDGGAEAHQ